MPSPTPIHDMVMDGCSGPVSIWVRGATTSRKIRSIQTKHAGRQHPGAKLELAMLHNPQTIQLWGGSVPCRLNGAMRGNGRTGHSTKSREDLMPYLACFTPTHRPYKLKCDAPSHAVPTCPVIQAARQEHRRLQGCVVTGIVELQHQTVRLCTKETMPWCDFAQRLEAN